MPRRDIEFHPGEFYHIYNRGAGRQKIFFESENYAHFVRKLRQFITGTASAHPQAADIVAYCLMPNHYHLLVQVLSLAFSDAMKSFGQSYTQAINLRFERSGTLFESRFQAIHVDREEYLLHLSRYIHLNPVAANLVRQPEAWEYSSYREYVGLRDGTLPKPDRILREFADTSAYKSFVEAGIGCDDPVIRHLLTD